jgi:nucleoside phosphorylase
MEQPVERGARESMSGELDSSYRPRVGYVRMDVHDIKGCVDFGIITIREDELEAVLDRFPKVDVVVARRRYRIRQLALPDGTAYKIAVVRCAEQGTTDALNTARDLLEDLAPAFLLVIGIAGGVPAYEFTLGDVIVSTRIVDFSVEAVLKDHSHEYALGGGPLHPEAAKLAADVRAMVRDGDLAGWNERASIGIDPPPVVMDGQFYGDDDWKKEVRDKIEHHFGGEAARPPLVVTGAVASSDRLIKEAETLQVWLKIARQIQAVEMESAGVYKAAHGRVPFLAIRGISDVIGFKRDHAWIEYACHTAAAFTRAFLLSRPIPPLARAEPEPAKPRGEPPPVRPRANTGTLDPQAIFDRNQLDQMELLLFARAIYRAAHISRSGDAYRVRINGLSYRATLRAHVLIDKSMCDQLNNAIADVAAIERQIERQQSPIGIFTAMDWTPRLDKAERDLRQLVHSFIDRLVVDA